MKAGAVSPVSSSAERMWCEDGFPDGGLSEIWLNVFDKLDRTDKLAFSAASSVWHDWVEPKRTESLISEVAPQLIETFHSENLLLGRELCQSWKEELEYKIQTNPSHTSLYFEIDSGQHWIPDLRSFRFRSVLSTVEKVESFMREMTNNPGNPFPARSIDLHCNFSEEVEGPEWNELQPEQLTMDSHVQLRECLLRLPNLKQVRFSKMDKSLLLENWIRDYYRLNPLPRLEHLETVQLNSASPALVGEVVNSCCVPANIKRLSYQHGQWHAHRGELPEVVYSFVNLKVGNLCGDSYSVRHGLYDPRAKWGEFSCNLPNLKKLSIHFYVGPLELLFQFKSLIHLELFRIRDSNGEWLDGREKQPVEERLGDNSVENWILKDLSEDLVSGLPVVVSGVGCLVYIVEVMQQLCFGSYSVMKLWPSISFIGFWFFHCEVHP
ncbi:hypothetical protein Ocin01_15944, partial [Orchesella cincta]